MKIVVLLENHALSPALQAEHGLAVYLEKDGFRMVFDMGETDLFMENAKTLGIDLSQLNAIAFSHNHYDHSGGFLSYVKCGYAPVPVYVHSGYFRRKWWDHSKDPVEEPTYKNALELVGPVMTPEYFFQNGYMKFRMLAADVFEVAPDIYLIGNFALDRENEPPHPSSTMELDPVTLTGDDFRDEQICVIRSKKGLVVLTGCAHNGLMNIMRTIEQRFPGETIHAIFGGTHLVQSDESRIQKTIDYINSKELGAAGVCHCTGSKGLSMFQEQVPSYLEVGGGFVWSDEE